MWGKERWIKTGREMAGVGGGVLGEGGGWREQYKKFGG